jgi:hypothetical protein
LTVGDNSRNLDLWLREIEQNYVLGWEETFDLGYNSQARREIWEWMKPNKTTPSTRREEKLDVGEQNITK